MALAAGTQLGSFEITGQIGAGGMGEVYRATDTRLGREVAIKILPASLADDKDRLARFEREAKLLASLNHAHIASVYSLDEHDGTLYIAMELVEGETLEERLKSGALPVDDTLRIGLAIAVALEAAHEKGVVHRDLKPANVMLTYDGSVKVLDFGLAKAFAGDPDEASPGHSPALSIAMTQQGLILGTAGYMSPEQASGQATDQRADVWAFGVVLYEMLTGMPVFSGESVPHILAAVLQLEPNWDRLPKSLHWRIRQLLERCLTKKPRNRLHSIADARFEIETALNEPEKLPAGASQVAAAEQSRLKPRATMIGAVVAGMALTAAVAWMLWPTPTPPNEDRWRHVIDERLTFQGFDGRLGSPVTVSPDGQTLIFATVQGLHRLPVDALDSQPIPGAQTDASRISHVFFSPDGERLAFYDERERTLMRLSVDDGAAQPIADVEGGFFGGSWGANDIIVYANQSGLYRVDANGGPAEQIIATAEEDTETYRRPQLLPDGDSILVSLTTGGGTLAGGLEIDEATEVVVVSLESGERSAALFNFGGDAVYVETGHIVYARGDELFAVTFDTDALRVTSDPRRLVQGVFRGYPIAAAFHAQFSVANDGTLAYLEGGLEPQDVFVIPPAPLAWFDPSNNEEQSIADTEGLTITSVSLSPDNTQILWSDITGRQGESGPERSYRLWRSPVGQPGRTLVHGPVEEPIGGLHWIDNERAVLTLGTPYDGSGNRLAFVNVFGDGVPQALTTPNATRSLIVTGMTPDGEDMLVTYGEPFVERQAGERLGSGWRVGIIAVEPDENGEHPIEPLIQRQSSNGQILPEGNWIIYESFESGNAEIYIARYPGLEDREAITDGEYGSNVLLSPSGDAIYYGREDDQALMKVALDPHAETSPAGQPEYVSEDRGYDFSPNLVLVVTGDVALDGRLLLARDPAEAASESDADQDSTVATSSIVIDRGFGEDLKALTPTR